MSELNAKDVIKEAEKITKVNTCPFCKKVVDLGDIHAFMGAVVNIVDPSGGDTPDFPCPPPLPFHVGCLIKMSLGVERAIQRPPVDRVGYKPVQSSVRPST